MLPRLALSAITSRVVFRRAFAWVRRASKMSPSRFSIIRCPMGAQCLLRCNESAEANGRHAGRLLAPCASAPGPLLSTTCDAAPSAKRGGAPTNLLPALPTAACDPQVPSIVERLGKRYTPMPVPKGLPRYRRLFQCHRNCYLAVRDDARLAYVEGLARCPATGRLIGHVWVTMDGERAIDLTWRGQNFCHEGSVYRMAPTEYYGVEIPREDVLSIVREKRSNGLILEKWMARSRSLGRRPGRRRGHAPRLRVER
jgi:hypothetical protein